MDMMIKVHQCSQPWCQQEIWTSTFLTWTSTIFNTGSAVLQLGQTWTLPYIIPLSSHVLYLTVHSNLWPLTSPPHHICGLLWCLLWPPPPSIRGVIPPVPSPSILCLPASEFEARFQPGGIYYLCFCTYAQYLYFHSYPSNIYYVLFSLFHSASCVSGAYPCICVITDLSLLVASLLDSHIITSLSLL